ncbi:MAG: peptidase M50 [Gammaproteobacteria bacterium]|nr:peptidase M50 [Gammaproteobacteria bacterium]
MNTLAVAGMASAWQIFGPLRLRLRPDLRGQWHRYRDQTWWVIQDPLSGRHFRFNAAAERVLARLDGTQTLDALRAALTPAPAPSEILTLLARLHAAELLQGPLPPAAARLLEQLGGTPAADAGRWSNPLSLRIPLCDPDRFLARWLPWVQPLFTRGMFILWSVLVAVAALTAVMHGSELTADAAGRILTPHSLLLLWLLYLVIKLLHELGLAVAVKARGGEVHERGVMLLVLVPVPYVDASAAAAFPERRWRLLVGAAGMMVELMLAALALFVWLRLQPGSLASAIAYNTLLIGTLATLPINANPLLRYDGYYMLADGLGIPNLAGRARAYLGYLIQRYLYGLRDVHSSAQDSRERVWLFCYGVAAWVFRLVMTLGILWFLSGHYFLLGAALAIWAAVMYLVLPVVRQLRFLVSHSRLQTQRVRAFAVVFGMFLVPTLLLSVVPMPYSTLVQGEAWVPENGQIRALADGFVQTLVVEPGSRVVAGQPLLQLHNPEATMKVELLRGQLAEWQARHLAIRENDPAGLASAADRIANLRAELQQAQDALNELTIFSRLEGEVVLPDAVVLPGRYVRRGDLLGYVVAAEPTLIRAVVPQADAGRVQADLQGIRVRLASDAAIRPARLLRSVPAAGEQLPSPALGQPVGGPFAIDPSDAGGVRTTEKIFQFDVQLLVSGSLRIGERAWVRFDHANAPLLKQWYPTWQRLLQGRESG